MCGIAGLWAPRHSEPHEALVERAANMGRAVEHRGPDGAGLWSEEREGLALAFRRLAIIDLTSTGDQPMRSGCGRFVIVFNGEMYNYREMRASLEAARPDYPWRGKSDTEVFLAAASAWGVERALQSAEGMFALAIWDRERKALTLARDRLGEKPLYFALHGGLLAFGSELKAVRACGLVPEEVDRDAARAFMRYGYVPTPLSVFRGIHKLAPGHSMVIDAAALERGHAAQKAFWTRPLGASAQVTSMNEGEALARSRELLAGAVSRELVADVPVGAFLSGGIDSSLVVCLMRAAGCTDLNTFSVGIEGNAAYDESVYAEAVAKAIGTRHHALRVSAHDAIGVVPDLAAIYDEPFADSSQIPTVLLSRFARTRVKVALSGDGGDEVFGGYNRYKVAAGAWSGMRRMPRWARAGVSAGARLASSPRIVRAFPRRAMPERLQFRAIAEKLEKFARVAASDSAAALYARLTSQWDDVDAVLRDGRAPGHPALDALGPAPDGEGLTRWMMAADRATYLPDDILVKVDRASMSASLECRSPFLDHRLVEFAATLPLRHLVHGGTTKVLPRAMLKSFLPESLFARPKMGFGVPIGDWLRGPLLPWAEAHLSTASLERSGLVATQAVQAAWRSHLDGRRDMQHGLWNVLMWQEWFARNEPPAR